MPGNMVFIVAKSPEELAQKGGELFSRVVKEAVGARGKCMVALCGGSTPRRMHALLGQAPYCSQIPWEGVHLFWGDERCVPAHSRWSNFGRVREDLLAHVDIPPGNVHPMPTKVSPERGASNYEKQIPEIFDLIFLGLGRDGHTASLFPGDPALTEQKRRVVVVIGGDPFLPRLTVTFNVINRARNVVFLVSGVEKAGVVKSVIEDCDNRFPASQVTPITGVLTWILDKDAASMLKRQTPDT